MAVKDAMFDGLPNDLRQMISRPLEDFSNLPVLPVCHVFGECVDVLTGKSVNKGTQYFGFICKPESWASEAPKEDVLNGNALSDYEFPNRNRLGTGIPAGQIWISPGAMPMNREFFTGMGFAESKPMDECIVEMKGRKVLMEIGKETSERTGREYNVLLSLTKDPR